MVPAEDDDVGSLLSGGVDELRSGAGDAVAEPVLVVGGEVLLGAEDDVVDVLGVGEAESVFEVAVGEVHEFAVGVVGELSGEVHDFHGD